MQIEKIRSEGLLEKEALRQNLHDKGVAANYRAADQVWDNYYKTLFSLKTVAADLKKARAEAAELKDKVNKIFFVVVFLLCRSYICVAVINTISTSCAIDIYFYYLFIYFFPFNSYVLFIYLFFPFFFVCVCHRSMQNFQTHLWKRSQ